MIVIGIWIIVIRIVLSGGENHTCSSLMTPSTETLRFCESAMLENQSLVYFDYTSFPENSTGFCSCLLYARPATTVNFIEHGNSSKPGLGCGVNILVETGEINQNFGCYSTNLSQQIVGSEMRITIYREAFSNTGNADYACYSVFSGNNCTISIKCENEMALTPSTTTAAPTRTVVTEDVIIPIVLGIFILVVGGTILIIIHYRCRKNAKQEKSHVQGIKTSLEVYHNVTGRTENPLNNADVVNQEHVDGVSVDSHFASTELRASPTSSKNDKGMGKKGNHERLSVDGGNYPSVDFMDSSVSSQSNAVEDKQQHNGSLSVPVYAVVDKHKKPKGHVDNTDDSFTDKSRNTNQSSFEVQIEASNNERTCSSPIYAVPDKSKKKSKT